MNPRKFFITMLATTLLTVSFAKATFYAPKFDGRKMANGAIFYSYDMVAASNQYPLGTVLKITNILNGRSIKVTVQDRTAKRFHGLDLSLAAFRALGIKEKRGWALVMITVPQGK